MRNCILSIGEAFKQALFEKIKYEYDIAVAEEAYREYIVDHQEPIGEVIRNLGNEKGLAVIDIHTAFVNRNDLLSYDGVHPNSRGQVLVVAKVGAVM